MTHYSLRGRRGLTLMELLIVLAILATMTVLAVQITDGVIDQGRHDVSRQGLERMRDAIIGTADSEGAGFIADMGREPVNLLELTTGVNSYLLQPIDTDDDNTADGQVGSGWRGPYLRLPAGVPALLDGWGNPYQYAVAAGTMAFQSPGRDGDSNGDESGYNADLQLAISPGEYQGSVLFHVREIKDGLEVDPDLDGGEVVQIRIFHVHPATGLVNPPQVIAFTAGSSTPATFTHQTGNIPIGPVVARAVFRTTSAGPVTRTSPAVYLNMTPRANLVRKLILR